MHTPLSWITVTVCAVPPTCGATQANDRKNGGSERRGAEQGGGSGRRPFYYAFSGSQSATLCPASISTRISASSLLKASFACLFSFLHCIAFTLLPNFAASVSASSSKVCSSSPMCNKITALGYLRFILMYCIASSLCMFIAGK